LERTRNKLIWTVGTQLTELPNLPQVDGLSTFELAEYRNQKRALNDAIHTLTQQAFNVKHLIIRPGAVATQPQWPNGANVTLWANHIVDTWYAARKADLMLTEISLGYQPEATTLDP
jgi:hypothetical protein